MLTVLQSSRAGVGTRGGLPCCLVTSSGSSGAANGRAGEQYYVRAPYQVRANPLRTLLQATRFAVEARAAAESAIRAQAAVAAAVEEKAAAAAETEAVTATEAATEAAARAETEAAARAAAVEQVEAGAGDAAAEALDVSAFDATDLSAKDMNAKGALQLLINRYG